MNEHQSEVVLSCYRGIGLLDHGFESMGFIVLAAPEKIWGGDIRKFHMKPGVVDGVIGGSPCQTFSAAYRGGGNTNSMELLIEFLRVVHEAKPKWFLLENVPQVPDVRIEGYTVQRLDLWSSEFGLNQRRNRHFQFGSIDGSFLIVPRGERSDNETPTVCATDTETPINEMAMAQGLPKDFDIPAFRRSELRRAIGNGVAIPVAKAVAMAVKNRTTDSNVRMCACGCGRVLTGRSIQKTSGATCRSRYRYQKKKSREVVFYP